MEQGPVLIITFQAQVIMVIRSPKGDVVEGDPVSTMTAPASGMCLNQSQWRELTTNQTFAVNQPCVFMPEQHIRWCLCLSFCPHLSRGR